MTALIITFGIIALLTVLMLSSITIYVKITNQVSIKIGALGFIKYEKYITFPETEKSKEALKSLKKAKTKKEKSAERKAKKEAQKKAKEAKKVKKSAQNGEKDKSKEGEEPDEQSFTKTVSLVIELMKALVPKATKLLSHLRFERVIIKMTVVSDEADKTAIHYGMVGGGIYTLLGVLSNVFTVKIKCVEIAPDFESDKAKYDISFKAKLRFIFILCSLIIMAYDFIKTILKKEK